MIARLVWASLVQRPGRSLLLLFGYGLGVGVTIALLSIGGALVEQARDRELVGGGDLVVLPAGIDLETLKTGGVSSMFFTIEQAPFLYREVLSGPRFRGRVTAAAPWIDDELVYLDTGDGPVPASAGGMIPSLGSALGVEPAALEGEWLDTPSDVAWGAPGDSALYASLDAWHRPPREAAGDSTWAEWQYFNLLLPDGGWLYLTYMLAGDLPDGRWGGRLLATLIDGAGRERVFTADVAPDRIRFAEGRADIALGGSSVAIDPDGVYRLTAEVPAERGRDTLFLELTLASAVRRYLPPVEIGAAAFPSGYTVPLLDALASGRVCVSRRCTRVEGARAYHDHNWGVWQDVSWDWGQASLGPYALVYGGVARSSETEGTDGSQPNSPGADRSGSDGAGGASELESYEGSRFLFLTDSLGFAGIYPVREIRTRWSPAPAGSARRAPEEIQVIATRGADSLRLRATVAHVRATELPAGASRSTDARFFQMRGGARLQGRLDGREIEVEGAGFFETWSVGPPPEADTLPSMVSAVTRVYEVGGASDAGAPGPLARSRTETFDPSGRLLREVTRDPAGSVTLDITMLYGDGERPTGLVYRGADEPILWRERFDYSADARLKTITYLDETGGVLETREEVLDAAGRALAKRYFRADGTQYGREEVRWDDAGRQTGWTFERLTRPERVTFEYDYLESDEHGVWTRRILSRDGVPQAQEVRKPTYASIDGASFRWTGDAPIEEPRPIAPGTISTQDGYENLASFSPDGRALFFLRYPGDQDSLEALFRSDWLGDRWSEPVPISLAVGRERPDGDLYNAAVSQDGRWIAVGHDGRISLVPFETVDGDPIELRSRDGRAYEGAYFCMLPDGTLYFYSYSLDGGASAGDLYRARSENGGYGPPENLGAPVNSPESTDFGAWVDPEERVLVYTRAFEAEDGSLTESSGFYTSRNLGTRERPRWSEPRRIEGLVYGWGASFTPDGRYFVFSRDGDLYRVSTAALGIGDVP